MRYDGIRKRLLRKYQSIIENGTTYFIDSSNMVVATENDRHNLLVMYVTARKKLWCHHNTVAIAVAKNFMLINNYEVSYADVVVINGLCGACNTIQRTSNMLLSLNSSLDLDFMDSFIKTGRRLIGSMGYMKFATKAILNIGISIGIPTKILPRRRKSFDFDNLIYGVLSYTPVSRIDKKKGRKHIIQSKDYTIYNYLRNEYSWYWEYGYNTAGSFRTRLFINKTMNGTNYHKIGNAVIKEI